MDSNQRRVRNENPSFSSTLLDVIYRSIDEREDQESVFYKQNVDSLRRSCGSKSITGAVVRRKSATGFESSSRRSEGNGNSFYFSSNIGSSCSGFPSSEGETIYGFPARLRPIRTSIHEDDECISMTRESQIQKRESDDLKPKANCEGKFTKTKSRAMKIYGYLKKGKQPISPGGRLTSFLISLFTTANTKKSKISSPCTGGRSEAIVHSNTKSKSASSFSRSCMSEPPSMSRGKLTTGMRFFPTSVVIDDYSQRRGYNYDSPGVKFARCSINEERKKQLKEKNRHMQETNMTLLKSYQKKVKYVFDSIQNNIRNNDDDGDDGSCASSDLFELDHLSAIGIDQCMQDLPLYETTSVDANRAISNGVFA